LKKPVVFLVAAVALLGVAAWLMPSVSPTGETATSEPSAAPAYPTGPTAADKAKSEARKTLDVPATAPAPVPTDAVAPAPSTPPAAALKRDAIMVALPPSASDLIVMEAQTFVNRPIVRGLAQCLAMQGMNFSVDRIGLRAEDLDRVAIADLGEAGTLTVVTGDVSRLDISQLIANPVEARHGAQGRIYAAEGATPEERAGLWTVGRFREGLAIIGKPRAVVEQALDRLEGRAPSEVMFPDSEQFGDAYGRLTARSLRRVFPAELADKVDDAGLMAQFHMTANQDFLISADAVGEPEASQALGKATAAALAAKRADAASQGDKAMVKLLDTFRVRLAPNGFKLQAGFTEAYLKQQLGSCIEGGRPQ
jgi:hypothetical protein